MKNNYISNIYKFFLILFIILSAISPLAAEENRYRVEIIVLSHLTHEEEGQEVSLPRDYSPAIDFLTPLEATDEDKGENEEGESEEEPLEAPLAAADKLPVDSPMDAETAPEEIDSGPAHIEEMSETMQEAWRRLRLSGPFRPLQFLAWEQSADAPFPTLRIHDLDVLMIDDPYADLRAERLAERAALEAEAADRAPPGTKPEDGEAGDEADDDLPPPVAYYRLDGSVTLRRTRFLHLDVDIELRDPLYAETAPGGMQATPGAQGQTIATPSAFRVYRLQQSLQVKTGRMNYFDGPVLGVLAYLTPVEPAPPSAEAVLPP